jgi:hypothetical protein
MFKIFVTSPDSYRDTTIIACCVAHLYVRFAYHQTSPPNLLSKGEEAVLQCKAKLHPYHIGFISLPNILKKHRQIAESSKSEGCVLFLSFGEAR